MIKQLCCILYFLLSPFASMAFTDSLIYQKGMVKAANKLLYFEDKSGRLTIEDILKIPAEFKSAKADVPNFGVSESSFWVKMDVRNGSTESVVAELAYPILDHVNFYKIAGNKVVLFTETGEAHPFSDRKNSSNNFVFPLELGLNESASYYFQISSGKQIIVPLSVGTRSYFVSKEVNRFLLFGLYAGIFLAMILYNIFLYASTRDRTYLPYVAYIFFVGITQVTLNGYSFKYFWPEYPEIALRATQLCGAFSGIATIFFVKSFLNTRIYTPKFNNVLTGFLGLYLVSILLVLTNQFHLSYNLINVTAGLGSILLMVMAIYIYKRKKYRPALFFIIAWAVFIVSILIFVFKDMGLIPYNDLTISGLQIGSAIEVLLLSFALADRINILKAEKEKSREEALKALQENERIISEQNLILESRVKDRTFELSETNAELNQTLIDLKEAEGHLIEAEKMASLGQLTAGIAHEINNPINFVTSNVNPLRRDIGLLIETIETIEKVSLSALSQAEKQQQIEDYKEEIDFDYLKMEIGHLIKGIDEGAMRTAEIVKGLRIFSRLDEDDLKKANIEEGLDSTLIIVNNLFGKIVLEKNYGLIPEIECYPGKLNQVFLNIISNAIHAIKKRFGEEPGGKLNISTGRDENNIFIKISDNGTGMNEATKKKVFEPFFTTKDVGEGTGLGMSIAYNTIRKHQGEINIQSTPGLGTEFIIELPILMVAVEC